MPGGRPGRHRRGTISGTSTELTICETNWRQKPSLSARSKACCRRRMASSEGKVGKKECKENIAVGGKGRGRWGKQQGSLHRTCTIVHKQYQPYTLRNIYLTYFFCEILCPERQNYLKNLRFLIFLHSEKNTPELNTLAKYSYLAGMTKADVAHFYRGCTGEQLQPGEAFAMIPPGALGTPVISFQ